MAKIVTYDSFAENPSIVSNNVIMYKKLYMVNINWYTSLSGYKRVCRCQDICMDLEEGKGEGD